MPQPLADSAPPMPATTQRSALLVAGVLAGYCLTLFVFYPGIMTYDGRYSHEYAMKGTYGDWQSPVMTLLWAWIDPIAPGSASMFLLIATLYWLAFGLLAFAIARVSVLLAAALLVLAILPPAFSYVGIIWRDVLFASTWLLAAALVARRDGGLRTPVVAVALALLAFGVLIRPNALLAAPLLGVYILWPAQYLWKRALLLYVPMALAFFALVQFVYYGALHAKREHLLQTIMVFDLGGISHFAKENQFPGTWTGEEKTLITTGCYHPTDWDIYWIRPPCIFVMQRLDEGEKLFGTPAIVQAWTRAIVAHPIAYLQHRSAFMWNFLAGRNLTIWTLDVYDPPKIALAGRSGFAAVRAIDDALKPTPLSRAGTWLLGCLVICAFAWPRRDRPSGAFAIGLCGSAAVYVLTFYAVGVASDFRYAYPAVLAALAGGVALAAPLGSKTKPADVTIRQP
jgi:hypothetical protein